MTDILNKFESWSGISMVNFDICKDKILLSVIGLRKPNNC